MSVANRRPGIRVILLVLNAAACSGSASDPRDSGSSSAASTTASSSSALASHAGSSSASSHHGPQRTSESASRARASSGMPLASVAATSSVASQSSVSSASASTSRSLPCGATGAVLGPAVVVPVAPTPLAVAIADVNGDGIADLVASDARGASILLRTTGGAYAPEERAVGGAGGGLLVQDFNGDGKADLMAFDGAVARFAAQSSGGSFSAFAAAVAADGTIVASASGDLDGNGEPDLVMLTTDLDVALNLGAGTFPARASSYGVSWTKVFGAFGRSGLGVATADVDGDGLADILIASNAAFEDGAPSEGGLCVVKSSAHGTRFTDPECVLATADLDVSSLVVADFDGDGAPDVALAGGGATNTFNVFLNVHDGTGRFRPAVGLTTTGNARVASVVAGDVDGDGLIDLVGLTSLGQIVVSRGHGDGTFATGTITYAIPGGTDNSVSMALGPVGQMSTSEGSIVGLAVVSPAAAPGAPHGGVAVLAGACAP